MLRVGDSPFFVPFLERMRSIGSRFHQLLIEEIHRNYLGGESLQGAKACLRGLYEFRAFLANLGHQIHPHPYEVFKALQSLYLDVCVFREVEPTGLDRRYEHEGLGPLFTEVLDQREEQIELSRTSTPYTPFARKEGLQGCDLTDEAKRAKKVYLLIQKPAVSAEVDLSGLKLASESPVSLVHQRALRGVPFRRIENPPFHHNFSAEVEFYAVSEGEEWDHAIREGKIAFFHRPQMQGMRPFIYWRTD